MHVLVVDDDSRNRYLLRTIFGSAGHKISEAAEGQEALDVARAEPPDVIIADILMPGMDGYALCREWRADPVLADKPFVFYSANYTENEDEQLASKLGADLFLTKPRDPTLLLHEIEVLVADVAKGAAVAHPLDDSDDETLREHNARLLRQMEQQLTEVGQANLRLLNMINGTVTAIAKLVEARDPYTAGHQERVAALAHAIALEMGMSDDDSEGIRLAGVIHDIGKIYVPSGILTRPGQLSDPEFAIIKMHPDIAFNVLSGIDFPWPIADYVHQHHERLDGSGYPQGLPAQDILPGSRVIAIADVVEAMTNHRPYRPAIGIDAALEEIDKNSGRLYDSEAAAACARLFNGHGYELRPDLPHPSPVVPYSR